MSAQDQHAADVILESINVLNVNTAGARNLTNDATLENVSGQGNAVRYSINGTATSNAAWINAIAELKQAPLGDNVEMSIILKVISCAEVSINLALGLVNGYDVLTSKGSPVGPDGTIIGREIAALQFSVAASTYFGWLQVFMPSQRAKLIELGNKTYAAYEKAAAKYPSPQGKGSVSVEDGSGLDLSFSIPKPGK